MKSAVLMLVGMTFLIGAVDVLPGAEPVPRMTLDAQTREKCADVLRQGLKGDEFWPAIHAAEGLTLGGYAAEVLEFLKPKLSTERDAQKRCGIAREIVRAGDHSAASVMLEILASPDPHGHVHAAESLFKVFECGDRKSLQQAFAQNDQLTLKLMAAAALARAGDPSALQAVRELLGHSDPKHYGIAAWILGQIGDASDIARLKAQLSRVTDVVPRANFEHALAILGDDEGRQALERNLSSSDNLIRTYAATFASDARDLGAIPKLKELLNDGFADARIRAAQSLLMLAGPVTIPFQASFSPAYQELSPAYCWFHPRVAAVPGQGADGNPAVIMTIQKHLAADDHYSGLYFMRTNDQGKTWTGPTVIPELAWKTGDNNETIAVCDVTPGWLAHTGKLLLIGIKLRYSSKGAQLVDQPRSHECAYATFEPRTNKWSPWKMLQMPQTDSKFFLVAPGCVQWLEKPDGTLLIPTYFQRAGGGQYATTVLHCSFDGNELKLLETGSEHTVSEGRGLYEPSLALFDGKYYLTLRNDSAAYVTTSDDGLHFAPPQKWTFDDGKDLGSYNTQAHWLSHSDGLFLSYTRRGANNDHIARNRAPIFVAQVDPQNLQVLRRTEQALLPERGVMLGNFGAAAITSRESWVTDAEFLVGTQPHPRGADGSVWVGRVRWSVPNNQLK
ncbi:HEAT repeat domain-containing protein [Schlesneria paludicola]|uniref:HEAT repeat domain-containing protein n=1 Tax=Schlesneria paludicola TaxID=360056 RepID=UPI00029A9D02|nr:HEAT repeat domain-containing protein [Schlesneria paludicola]